MVHLMAATSLRRHVRYCSLAFEACRTVHVTATLRSGAVIPDQGWYPAPLDGILAHAARRRRLGPSHGLVVDHHHDQLPLTSTARRTGGAQRAAPQPLFAGHRWVWAASCAYWPEPSDIDVRWVHKRSWQEAQAASLGIDAAATPANPDVGRYKPQRIPQAATIVPQLHWWALGDPAGIHDLLADVDAVGKRHNTGEGQVARWHVTDLGPPDWWQVMWFPDGRIARPIHPRHAAALGLDHPDTVTVDAYRPPYWRAPMHNGRRQLVEVIAPWTTRPSPSTAT